MSEGLTPISRLAPLVVYGFALHGMAFMINRFGHENAPKGYKFPEYSSIWMAGIGALWWALIKAMVMQLSNGMMKGLVAKKGATDREVQKAASKAATCLS